MAGENFGREKPSRSAPASRFLPRGRRENPAEPVESGERVNGVFARAVPCRSWENGVDARAGMRGKLGRRRRWSVLVHRRLDCALCLFGMRGVDLGAGCPAMVGRHSDSEPGVSG